VIKSNVIRMTRVTFLSVPQYILLFTLQPFSNSDVDLSSLLGSLSYLRSLTIFLSLGSSYLLLRIRTKVEVVKAYCLYSMAVSMVVLIMLWGVGANATMMTLAAIVLWSSLTRSSYLGSVSKDTIISDYILVASIVPLSIAYVLQREQQSTIVVFLRATTPTLLWCSFFIKERVYTSLLEIRQLVAPFLNYLRTKWSVIGGNAVSGALTYFWVGSACLRSESELLSLALTLTPLGLMIFFSSLVATVGDKMLVCARAAQKLTALTTITTPIVFSFWVVAIACGSTLAHVALDISIVNMLISQIHGTLIYCCYAGVVDIESKNKNIYKHTSILSLLTLPLIAIGGLSPEFVIILSTTTFSAQQIIMSKTCSPSKIA